MNNVQKIREQRLMSKAELARRSGLSALTIDRVEGGKSCRVDTMRKIILALGLSLEDRDLVFDQDSDETDSGKKGVGEEEKSKKDQQASMKA